MTFRCMPDMAFTLRLSLLVEGTRLSGRWARRVRFRGCAAVLDQDSCLDHVKLLSKARTPDQWMEGQVLHAASYGAL